MTIEASSVEDYIEKVNPEHQSIIVNLRQTINKNIPEGFFECINYKMIGWVVPHDLYPKGYHCDPKLPLPFVNIASQKNFIAFYHMGLYANEPLKNWFIETYHLKYTQKLDMGKSCIRFKKNQEIPYDLIGELMSKITTADWIEAYENAFVKK